MINYRSGIKEAIDAIFKLNMRCEYIDNDPALGVFYRRLRGIATLMRDGIRPIEGSPNQSDVVQITLEAVDAVKGNPNLDRIAEIIQTIGERQSTVVIPRDSWEPGQSTINEMTVDELAEIYRLATRPETAEYRYVTFGQNHLHEIGGQVFDKNCIAKVKGSRATIFNLFGDKFCYEYTEPLSERDMVLFPRGVIEVKQ